VIYLHAWRRRPEKPVRVLLNGREIPGVVMVAALWNGGPGFVKAHVLVDGSVVVDREKRRVLTHTRFGLVRVEVRD